MRVRGNWPACRESVESNKTEQVSDRASRRDYWKAWTGSLGRPAVFCHTVQENDVTDRSSWTMSKARAFAHAWQSNQPPFWTNQDIHLYHGTIRTYAESIQKKVDLTKTKPANDFGPGFYTTTVFDQAKAWAFTIWIRRGQPPKNKPAVVEFVVSRDKLAKLESLWFVRGDRAADDYWSLVWHCRQGAINHARHKARPRDGDRLYDLVVGPVALQWRALQTMHDSDQVSFHTGDAADILNDLDKSKRRISWSLR